MAIEFQTRNAGGMVSGGLAPAAINNQSGVIASWEPLQWVKEGRVFSSGAGVLTTPGTVTATGMVRQQPDFMLRVPPGIVVIPLYAQLLFEITGGAIAEGLISVCDNDPGTSNVTATTPTNVNTRFAATASRVTAYKTATGATGTAPTNVSDLFRICHNGTDMDATGSSLIEHGVYAPLQGKGQLAIVGSASTIHAYMIYMACGTSASGWIVATWAEFTYAEFYGS